VVNVEIESLKLKLGATRPTARQYESVRADIELDITLDLNERMDEVDFKTTWRRVRNKAKIMLLEAMADAEKGVNNGSK
tara:strand:+ start:405 stop:641 length:237 start_codon:yes stop_codon:yes gene_type:complete